MVGLGVSDPTRVEELRFGVVLRQLRDERRMSRERLAFRAGMSSSYIVQLESGKKEHPADAVVHALIRSLDAVVELQAGQRQLLLDLAGLGASEFPSVGQLQRALSEDLLKALDLYGQRPAAYLDVRWNLLACNNCYGQTFPGLCPGQNVLSWMLNHRAAQDVLEDWDQECRRAVHCLRGAIVRNGWGDWAQRLVTELGRSEVFRRIWNAGGMTYGRDDPIMRIRDPRTDQQRTLMVQLFGLPGPGAADRIQFFLGVDATPST